MIDIPAYYPPIAVARSHFPGADRAIFLDTSAHGLVPAGAREAAARYLEDCIGEGGSRVTMHEALLRIRRKFAALIAAMPEEIAVTKNVTEGISAVVAAIPWQRGDNAIICAALEHPNSIYALYNLRERFGIEVRDVTPAQDMATPVDTIATTMDDRTRIVIVSTVTFGYGTRTDLDALAARCRERDVILLVDGAQSLGALHLDVSRTPIDALAVGASKFLCGPPGIGFLFVRRALAEAMRPASLGLYSLVPDDAMDTHLGVPLNRLKAGAQRFEAGSFNYLGANAVEPALDILIEVTVPAIEHHVLALASRFCQKVRELPLPLLGSDDPRRQSHIVVVGARAGGAALQDRMRKLYTGLGAAGVKTTIRNGELRFAFHLYNTEDEVDTVLSVMRAAW